MHCSTQPRQLQLQREEPASICSYQRLRSVSANRQNKTKPRNNNHDNKNATEPLRTKTSPQKKKKKNTTANTFPLSVSTEPLSFGEGGERLTFLTSLTRWYSVLDGPCLCGEKHKNEAT